MVVGPLMKVTRIPGLMALWRTLQGHTAQNSKAISKRVCPTQAKGKAAGT